MVLGAANDPAGATKVWEKRKLPAPEALRSLTGTPPPVLDPVPVTMVGVWPLDVEAQLWLSARDPPTGTTLIISAWETPAPNARAANIGVTVRRFISILWRSFSSIVILGTQVDGIG